MKPGRLCVLRLFLAMSFLLLPEQRTCRQACPGGRSGPRGAQPRREN